VIAFNHPASVLKKSAVQEAGGYRQEFWPAEDIDLWNRIVERGHRVAVQDEYLLKYRIHGSSASIGRARLMQQKAIWMEQCIACRRAGNAEPTWNQFVASRKAAGAIRAASSTGAARWAGRSIRRRYITFRPGAGSSRQHSLPPRHLSRRLC
jgi:hypothetical protein